MMAAQDAAPAAETPAAPEDDRPEMDIDFWTLLVEARIIQLG